MPIKANGIQNINRKLDQVARDVSVNKSERALYIAGTVGLGHAALITPIDTSVLVNSQFLQVTPNKAIAGYTANYAAAVHSKPGTLLGKNVPRKGGKSFVWSPNGEPQFLAKGFNDNLADVYARFAKEMKL